MNKTILTLGLVSILSSSCARSEWKRAVRDVKIPEQTSCYDYAKEWAEEARRLGYDAQSVTYFPDNKLPGHAVVRITELDGQERYIEPQTNWKIRIFPHEQVFMTNYRNGLK